MTDDKTRASLQEAIILLELDRDNVMPPGGAAERAAILRTIRDVIDGVTHDGQGYAALKAHEMRQLHFNNAARFLAWYVDTGQVGEKAVDYARVIGALRFAAHEQAIDPRVGKWMEQAGKEELQKPVDSKNFELMTYSYGLKHALPGTLVRAISESVSSCHGVWNNAKALNDWNGALPHLEKHFALIREAAGFYADHLKCDPYDAILQTRCRSNSRALIDPLFEKLKTDLPPLMHDIMERQSTWGTVKTFETSPAVIDSLCRTISEEIGFSLKCGVIGKAPHPFSTGSRRDARITSGLNADTLSTLFGILHEAGHAIYNQNTPEETEGQPVSIAGDISIHESQSLSVERHIGKTHAFLNYLYEKIVVKDTDFKRQGSVGDLERAVLKVSPSFIRFDADEVSYPLHVILRYEIEKLLFDGEMRIADIPDVWNEKFEKYLGLKIPDHRVGCLQDMHWFVGLYGYFPTYTQGALYAAQLDGAARRDIPDLDDRFRRGDFKALREWMTDKIHRHGQLYSGPDLIARATGEKPSTRFFIEHLKARYLA